MAHRSWLLAQEGNLGKEGKEDLISLFVINLELGPIFFPDIPYPFGFAKFCKDYTLSSINYKL